MNYKRSPSNWFILYFLVLSFLTISLFFIVVRVENLIEENNNNPIHDYPIYEDFDNILRYNTIEIIAEDYDDSIHLNGYVIDTTIPDSSVGELFIDYIHYKKIQINDDLIIESHFGETSAKVLTISDQVIQDKVKITVEFDNTSLRLLNNSNLSSSIILKSNFNAIIVPSSFIEVLDNFAYVYIMNNEQTRITKTNVTILNFLINQDRYVIVGDIYEGDIIAEVT